MNENKMNASISLDLDNQWAYMKVHGDEGWDDYPSYFNTFLPHGLKMLKKYGLEITFFIVGRDADDEKNKDILGEITKNNHEVGNHSYNHEAWFHLYSDEEIYKELNNTEEAIQKVTGVLPKGFRGPGFSRSLSLFKILKKRPTFTMLHLCQPGLVQLQGCTIRQSNLSKEERATRKDLFGSFSDGFKRIKPFFWNLENDSRLLEIPVSTIPILRLPFHFSYLHYLANVNIGLMKAYLQTAVQLCKITNTEPSFLLHPLDLIGGDLIPELKSFPGMDLSSSYKTELFEIVMNTMTENFNLINMSEHAKTIIERGGIPLKTLN
jgi:hypothetical protein